MPTAPTRKTRGHDEDTTEAPDNSKVKRVKRACDQCRLGKWKCDAQTPCRTCEARGWECTYLRKSRRSRLEYFDEVETKLSRLKTLFHTLWPSTDIDELLDHQDSEALLHQFAQKVLASRKSEVSNGVPTSHGHEIVLDTMLEELPLGLQGRNLRKFCSRLTLLSIIRDRCSQLLDHSLQNMLQQMDLQQVFGWDRSPSPLRVQSPFMSNVGYFPIKSSAQNLISAAMDNGCALVLFVHRPSCDDILNRIYNARVNGYVAVERTELALIYALFAMGELFSTGSTRMSESYFKLARGLIDLDACKDVASLQAIIAMALYLQSKFVVSSCREFVDAGVATLRRIRGARPLSDKHRSVVEREVLRRAFWTLWNLDIHLTSMLGLPQLLDWDLRDEDVPMFADDEFLLQLTSANTFAERHILVPAAEAHTQLTMIQAKILKSIYQIHEDSSASVGRFRVDYEKVLNIEQDLEGWYSNVFQQGFLGRSGEVLRRTALLMSIAYARAQMSLYLPFLHHIFRATENINPQMPSYACAVACIKAAMHEISLVKDMHQRGLLAGSYWFLPSATFTAVMTLLMGIVADPKDQKSRERLERAKEGTVLLAAMTKSTHAFKKCLHILSYVIERIQLAPEDLSIALQQTRNQTGFPAASGASVSDASDSGALLPAFDLSQSHLPIYTTVHPNPNLMQLHGYIDENTFPCNLSAPSEVFDINTSGFNAELSNVFSLGLPQAF